MMKLPVLLTEMTLGPSSPVMVMALPTRVAVVVAEAAAGRARNRAATRIAGRRHVMARTTLTAHPATHSPSGSGPAGSTLARALAREAELDDRQVDRRQDDDGHAEDPPPPAAAGEQQQRRHDHDPEPAREEVAQERQAGQGRRSRRGNVDPHRPPAL